MTRSLAKRATVTLWLDDTWRAPNGMVASVSEAPPHGTARYAEWISVAGKRIGPDGQPRRFVGQQDHAIRPNAAVVRGRRAPVFERSRNTVMGGPPPESFATLIGPDGSWTICGCAELDTPLTAHGIFDLAGIVTGEVRLFVEVTQFTGSNEMEFRSETSRGEADGRSGGAQYVGA